MNFWVIGKLLSIGFWYETLINFILNRLKNIETCLLILVLLFGTKSHQVLNACDGITSLTQQIQQFNLQNAELL